MTLLEHVYAIKNLIAHGPASADFSYSDRLIAHFLLVCRAKLIREKADKYSFISEQSHQDLCLDLEKGTFHNCCDTPDAGCILLKSTIALPKFLSTKWGNYIKVTDMSGRVISEINVTQNRFSTYSRTGTQTGWFIHDNHLYVLNNTFLNKVLINALFDDPALISELNCGIDADNCPDFMEEEFPVDSDITQPMYELALKFLVGSMTLPKDNEQDAQDQTSR